MFDVSWSELLIVGVVALLVVGPKEMPTLLRTVGKYVGIIRRQAAEFRAQFDEAIREAELDQLRKEVENVKAETEGAFRDAEASISKEVDDARHALDEASTGGYDNHETSPSDNAGTNGAPTVHQTDAGSPAIGGHTGANGHDPQAHADQSQPSSRPDVPPGEPKAPA